MRGRQEGEESVRIAVHCLVLAILMLRQAAANDRKRT
jgi:hypothetical protein